MSQILYRRHWIAVAATALIVAAAGTAPADDTPTEIRVGVIGLDTSHVIRFTQLLNSDAAPAAYAGCRIVAAYPKGSEDIESSVSRVPKYTEQVQQMGVEIVDSIPALLERVDAVLLESNDGRVHLRQALPVLEAGKPMFIDKPMAASLADVMAIFEAARHYNTPVFSTSSLRYGKGTVAVQQGAIGDVLGCDVYSPCSLEATHPDFFWYGIHGVEALVAVMGNDCQSVSRTHTEGSDVAVGVWEGGRIGTFRGMRVGKPTYGGTAFGADGNHPVGDYDGYEPLVADIVKFFRTGVVPVSEEETIAVFAFMEAADESKRQGGGPVSIADIVEQARQQAVEKRTWRGDDE